MEGYDGDIHHIMPAMGTLLLANRKEPRRIHLYKLEFFDQEIGRLAQDSGFHELVDLYQQVPFRKSPCKCVIQNLTTRAARALLYPSRREVSLESKEESEPGMDSASNTSNNRFLKALCRIYYQIFFALDKFPSV